MTPRRVTSPRDHYLISDFTPSEIRQINAHCKAKGISVSTFLANLAVTEVRRASKAPPKEEEITITLKVPAEQKAKLKMFAHRQDKTYEQFLRSLVLPTLRKAKTSFTSKTRTLRYYVSAEDHKTILKFLKERKLSGRTYISYLALEALEREKSPRRSKKK